MNAYTYMHYTQEFFNCRNKLDWALDWLSVFQCGCDPIACIQILADLCVKFTICNDQVSNEKPFRNLEYWQKSLTGSSATIFMGF